LKKTLFIFLLSLLSIISFSQDIVYDSLRGNRDYWRRIKVGNSQIPLNIFYENEGIICKSKVLLSAGIWYDIKEGVDYQLWRLNSDTITFEYKSDRNLNFIVYKYYTNESAYTYFFGIRKAQLGDYLFTGEYLFVCPIRYGAIIDIYEGIGNNKKLFKSFNGDQMDDSMIADYDIGSQITCISKYDGRILLHPITIKFLPIKNIENDVKIWPNPVNSILHIEFLGNTGCILKIYNNGLLMTEKTMNEETIEIDVSSYKKGTYVIVFLDPNNKNIIYTAKIIKM
jgi:hypothetical protein